VIGIPHPKWDERPLLIVVPEEGHEPQREDVPSSPKIAKMAHAGRHAGGERKVRTPRRAKSTSPSSGRPSKATSCRRLERRRCAPHAIDANATTHRHACCRRQGQPLALGDSTPAARISFTRSLHPSNQRPLVCTSRSLLGPTSKGSNCRVRGSAQERLVMCLCRNSVYGRFTAFSARSGPTRKARSGSKHEVAALQPRCAGS
jgi:hypothetical protein